MEAGPKTFLNLLHTRRPIYAVCVGNKPSVYVLYPGKMPDTLCVRFSGHSPEAREQMQLCGTREWQKWLREQNVDSLHLSKTAARIAFMLATAAYHTTRIMHPRNKHTLILP